MTWGIDGKPGAPIPVAENPYNEKSRMHRMFDFLNFGGSYSTDRITAESTGYQEREMSRREWMILRRRITAALRTIRRQDNGVTILYNPKTETYQMVREEI